MGFKNSNGHGRGSLGGSIAGSPANLILRADKTMAEEALVSEGVLPRSNEDMLGEWLGHVGQELEAVSLDYVLARHGPVGEMVPTGSGEIPLEASDFQVPGVVRREGRWAHEGGFAGAGGRKGRHSEDFLPLWEEMTALYRAHPGARW